jgi:Family of unknown function (DUF6502)
MSDDAQLHLVEAFRKILRPLVKILIRSGVRFEEFTQLAKTVYVESAIRDGTGLPGGTSVAAVSMATGLTAEELGGYVERIGSALRPRPTVAAAILELLHRWHTDGRYLGPYGVPLELEIAAGSERSFSDLVHTIDARLDPHVLLEELLKAGTVVRTGDKYVKAVSRAFLVQEPMSAVMLEYFGNTVTNLTSTLEHNMDRRVARKRIQRSVLADRGLSDRQVAELNRFAAERVQQLMVDLDNWLADVPADADCEPAKIRDVGISVFEYVRSRESEPELRTVLEKLPQH